MTSLTPAVADTTATRAQADTSVADALDHAAWTDILAAYVKPGDDGVNRFDYGGLKANAKDLARLQFYIKTIEQTDISGLERDAQFAAWANLYNALTINLVIEEYPVKSIMRIRPRPWSIGPWKKEITNVGGRDLSLDDIEHGILRKEWSDPRIHYAVNCASYGCPNLQTKAWTADTLDEDLTAAAIEYVNHPRGVEIRSDGRLQVSTIYKWFREDFGDSEEGVIDHLLEYAKPELATQIQASRRIADYEYDWSLNDSAS